MNTLVLFKVSTLELKLEEKQHQSNFYLSGVRFDCKYQTLTQVLELSSCLSLFTRSYFLFISLFHAVLILLQSDIDLHNNTKNSGSNSDINEIFKPLFFQVFVLSPSCRWWLSPLQPGSALTATPRTENDTFPPSSPCPALELTPSCSVSP